MRDDTVRRTSTTTVERSGVRSASHSYQRKRSRFRYTTEQHGNDTRSAVRHVGRGVLSVGPMSFRGIENDEKAADVNPPPVAPRRWGRTNFLPSAIILLSTTFLTTRIPSAELSEKISCFKFTTGRLYTNKIKLNGQIPTRLVY